MSVKSKRCSVKGVGRVEFAVSAADLFSVDHPLHKTWVKWLESNGKEFPKDGTKRQAAKFLQAHPQYREAQSA